MFNMSTSVTVYHAQISARGAYWLSEARPEKSGNLKMGTTLNSGDNSHR